MAIWPFIILRNRDLKNDNILLNHEKIHLKQQKELLWFLFFIIYFIEFLAKIVIYKKPRLAYQNISFEREAYRHEQNFSYAERKSFLSFVKYV